MSLEVAPATEEDMPALMLVQFSAFDKEPYHEALFPGGNTPEARAKAAERTIQEWRATPQQHIIKCTDTKTGEIIGLGIWNLYDTERPESEWKKEYPIDWCDGEAKQRVEMFLGTTIRIRQKIWEGRPHYLCALLCVHQNHQRRGAGAAMIQWGLERADRVKLPAYLEASIYGRPLYHKLGYQDMEEEIMIIPAEKVGRDQDQVYMPMIRHPLTEIVTTEGIKVD